MVHGKYDGYHNRQSCWYPMEETEGQKPKKSHIIVEPCVEDGSVWGALGLFSLVAGNGSAVLVEEESQGDHNSDHHTNDEGLYLQ